MEAIGVMRVSIIMLVLLFVINETYYTRFYHSEKRDGHGDTLSLLISPRSFQFCVFNQGRKAMRELGHIDLPPGTAGFLADEGQLEFLLNNYRLVNGGFEKTFVSVLHPDFALAPGAFAENLDLKQLLVFNGSDSAPASTGRHRLGDIEFSYSMALPVQQLLERSFSNGLLRHSGAVSINLLMSHPGLSASNVFLNVQDGMIELLALRNKQLLFYNVFSVETAEDILYYLLFMAEQFELSAKEILISVCGMVNEDLLALIKKFTGGLHIPDHASPFLLTGKFAAVEAHRYFTLFNQHLCEL